MALSDVLKTASKLHGWHHDNYDEAKKQIWGYLGSLDDLEVFGRDVFVAMYVRPNINPKTGFIMGARQQTEDVYSGKVVMIVKCGPDAFDGDDGWLKARFGDKQKPEPGDWCFMPEGAGDAHSLYGDGAKRSQSKDARGELMDVYDWDGWPCRLVRDEQLRGRLNKPHQVV